MPLNPYLFIVKIAALIGIALTIFYAGYRSREPEIADLKLQMATMTNKSLTDAIKVQQANTQLVADNAKSARQILDDLLKVVNDKGNFTVHVKTHPLPTDCKPDDFRVQHLQDIIDKSNGAIKNSTGSDPSKGLP